MESDRTTKLSEDVRALATSPESSEGSRALTHLLDAARQQPHELLPVLPELSGLLDSASGQVREASLQSIALISRAAPGAVAFLLPRLHTILSKDSTESVSEQVIEILTNYGRSSRVAAERVLPILRGAVDKVHGHTIQPLITAFGAIAEKLPERGKEVTAYVERLQHAIGDNFRVAASKVRGLKRDS